MRILLHTCCAPCLIYPAEFFLQSGADMECFFFNPNIHPYSEYARRKKALKEYADESELRVIFETGYKMEEFLQAVVFKESQRCRSCYVMRLDMTARQAALEKFNYFSTTLLVSPYQKHDLIHDLGKKMEEKYGVAFYYHDFRTGYHRAVDLCRAKGIYRQKYCGCIYSEKERFVSKKQGGTTV